VETLSRESESASWLKELVELAREQLKWARVQGIVTARQVLSSSLRNDSEKLAYQFSDGRGSQEVAKVAGVSYATVTIYWKKWATLGVVEPMKVQGGTRYRRIFSLEDLGIEVPRMSVSETTRPAEEAATVLETENV